MNLFLGSQGLRALGPWLDGLTPRPARALLVPTAGNPMPATPWVEAAEAALVAEGLAVRRFDLARATPDQTSTAVADSDLVFVTGGHLFFLLDHAQRTGFLTGVALAVRGGRLAYAGMSAGAALAAGDLARYWSDDDRPRSPDTQGLRLIPFHPLSHANRGRAALYAQMLAEEGDRHDLVPLRDDQAIIVRGTAREIRPS